MKQAIAFFSLFIAFASLGASESSLPANPSAPEQVDANPKSSFSNLTPQLSDVILRLSLLLGAPIGIYLILSWLLKRSNRINHAVVDPKSILQLIESFPVNSRRMIHILQVGQLRLAVSSSGFCIESICPISESFSRTLDGIE